MLRDLHRPGRSPVMATRAMVATSHPLATVSALELLREGGSAMDAAVAAAAVLAVVEPFATGIGGDCFLLYHHARSAKLYGLNGSGRAGSAADPAPLAGRGLERMPERGATTVTVPGAVAAWAEAVERFGRMPLSWVLQPAINIAERGFAVTPVVARQWQDDAAVLAADAGTAGVFLSEGRAPRPGEIHRQPDLARSLRQIAEGGAEVFYRGPIGKAIVQTLEGAGGWLTLEDLRRHRSRWVDPIATSYRGLDIHELPPNGQGITALMLMNLLEQRELPETEFGSARHLALLCDAFALAREERDRWIGDPDFSPIPMDRLLSKAHAAELWRSAGHGGVAPPASGGREPKDTVYLCVVDESGNAASLINSLYYSWGSGLTGAGTGIVLHNRGASFNLLPGHPNCLAPGKRPMHTIIPAMGYEEGRLRLCFGVVGGHYQALGQAYILSNYWDFGLDPQAAVDAPRFFPSEGMLELEAGIAVATLEGLRADGRCVRRSDRPLGGAQMITVDPENGVRCAGSDPRKDGCALGY